MAQAEFRFYATLNDFLPPARRGRTLLHQAAENASVKQAIEALGVPHPEVALLLADGAPVDFNHRVRDGMRISAYPKLTALGAGLAAPATGATAVDGCASRPSGRLPASAGARYPAL